MNPHILFVIDHQLNPGKYTQEQLEANCKSAYATTTAWAELAHAVAYTARNAAYAAATAYWLHYYFSETGENKQDYIDAINKEAQS